MGVLDYRIHVRRLLNAVVKNMAILENNSMGTAPLPISTRPGRNLS